MLFDGHAHTHKYTPIQTNLNLIGVGWSPNADTHFALVLAGEAFTFFRLCVENNLLNNAIVMPVMLMRVNTFGGCGCLCVSCPSFRALCPPSYDPHREVAFKHITFANGIRKMSHTCLRFVWLVESSLYVGKVLT